MRVLIAADQMGAIPAHLAGAAIAHGWREVSDEIEVAVLPCGDAGAGFIDAVAALWGTSATVGSIGDQDALATFVDVGDRAAVAVTGAHEPGFHPKRSSAALGRAVAELLTDDRRPRQLVVDLAGLGGHDGGAGFLAALGAVADVPLTQGVEGLTGLSHIDITAVTERLAGIELIGVIPVAESSQLLLGLRGITSRRGADLGLDPAVMLRTDASLERLATLIEPHAARLPGAGACGGLGWAIAALGGRIVSALDLVGEWADVETTAREADVVIAGTTSYDFHHKGGGVVDRAAAWADLALRPCVVLAGEVMISDREMRLMGIEAAYSVPLSDPQLLQAAVARVARSWSWG